VGSLCLRLNLVVGSAFRRWGLLVVVGLYSWSLGCLWARWSLLGCCWVVDRPYSLSLGSCLALPFVVGPTRHRCAEIAWLLGRRCSLVVVGSSFGATLRRWAYLSALPCTRVGVGSSLVFVVSLCRYRVVTGPYSSVGSHLRCPSSLGPLVVAVPYLVVVRSWM